MYFFLSFARVFYAVNQAKWLQHIMFMFIRQSKQHYMPDIQRQTETDSETDKQTDRETYRQYDKLNKKRREK